MTTYCGRDIRIGDMLEMRTGPVRVIKTRVTHGGIEVVVRTLGRREDRHDRVLWFWPQEKAPISRGAEGVEPAPGDDRGRIGTGAGGRA